MNRREFLFAASMLAMASSVRAQQKRPPRIVLRSSWQTVNIGDVAHSPGVLRLLYRHIPDVEVRLWPSNVKDGVEEMLRKNFPKLIIAGDEIAKKAAMAECDFFLHGSGPSLVGGAQMAQWKAQTNKPYGVYGITLSAVDEKNRELLDGARFLFFRDTISLKLAQDAKLKCPVMEFAPDGAFAFDLRNDAAAAAFLKEHTLEEGKFLVAIPRLRYTPYWKIHNRAMAEADKIKHETSEKLKESDHAKVRAAIVAWVKQTGMKVLLVPEDKSHVDIGKEMILDKLPEDVRAKVAWRPTFWLPDEALSVYVRSAGLLSMDMHSPIMAVGNGIPAIHCRFKEQTSKGQMWADIGLKDWLFDLDEEKDGERITAATLALADPSVTRIRVAKALEVVKKRQQESMEWVGAM